MTDQKPTGVDAQQVLSDEATAPSETQAEQEQRRAVGEYSQHPTGAAAEMRIKVYSPFQDYYDGRAFSMTAENATGVFDVLPHHHSFISLLSPCELTIRTVKSGDQKIRISGGIMHVKADKVIVFLDV